MKTKKQKITHMLASIRTKIILLTLFTILLTLLTNLLIFIPETKKNFQTTIENNLYDLSTTYCKLLDDTLSYSGKETLSYNELASLLSYVKVKELNSSYAYLVDEDGIILYHPTTEKIGQPVENSYIMGVTQNIASGIIPNPDVINYNYRGEIKYASYAVSNMNHWTLVISADESEVLAPLQKTTFKLLSISIGLSIFLALISFLIATSICKPLHYIVCYITKIAQLDLAIDPNIKKFATCHDEIGAISRAILTMHDSLAEIVNEVNLIASDISKTARTLNQISIEVNDHSTTNSSTTEELAAGMEETAATTDTITQNINDIAKKAEHINKRCLDSATLSNSLLERSTNLSKSTTSAYKHTLSLYENVRDKSQLALIGANSTKRINTLSENIISLAKQTSMLALNASIEAARAGQSGRGFAVVAEQISKLAAESSKTSQDITNITSEVYTAVTNMSDCLHQILDFLENVVISDYKQFIDTGNVYAEEATQITKSIHAISHDTSNLENIIKQMSELIEGINLTMNEAAIGVTDITGKTTDVVILTSQTTQIANENMTNCKHLNHLINKFHLN